MRGKPGIVLLALVGVLLAASIGFAAYFASRDSVGLPVTKLEPKPRDLAPTAARRTTPARTTSTAAATSTESHGGTTTDDHSGRGRGGSGSGSGSGHGGGSDD
jgi:hypothetical protein